MKCDHCGKNEVSFVYQSNINGQITEKHLCGQCADALGYSQKAAAYSRRMAESMRGVFDGFFGNRLWGGLAGDLFTGDRSLPDFGGLWGRELFDDFFRDMPALGTRQEQPARQTEESREPALSQEEQARFARQRQLNQLRAELQEAVRQENYEHAAELRDQIRAMEREDR